MYKNGERVSADETPTATAVDVDTNEDVTLLSVVGESEDGYNYYWTALDSSEVTSSRVIKVTWSYSIDAQSFTSIEYINITTPLISMEQVYNEFPRFQSGNADPKTYEELKFMERKVRHAITSYTGQTFENRDSTTFKIMGTGSNYLLLPERIYELEYVEVSDMPLYGQYLSLPNGIIFGVSSDGTVINSDGELLYDENGDPVQSTQEGQPVYYKNTLGELVEVSEPTYQTADLVEWDKENPWVIRGRNSAGREADWTNNRQTFANGRVYTVRGKAGWKHVPAAVNDAAMLLISDYFDPDHEFYAKGLEDMKSADYSFKYANDPYSTTGNTIADKILSQYINLGVHVF